MEKIKNTLTATKEILDDVKPELDGYLQYSYNELQKASLIIQDGLNEIDSHEKQLKNKLQLLLDECDKECITETQNVPMDILQQKIKQIFNVETSF